MVDGHYSHRSFESEGKTVHIYTSNRTGLSCIHVDLATPTVSGHFTLVTECFDDTGSPHTLEHLVFLGSKLYPYKGILDSLANRAFAQGTNAWTDVDHTAYTIDTVGAEGFLRILPIFVDHILHPTLTESGCYTEVHHVNGDGHDAGVVYSEMQGVENTGPNLMNLRAQRVIHDAKSAYRSETGGLMAAIRGLSVQRIRDYHAQYYVPQNLVLVVTGRVDGGSLMRTLESVDDNILAQRPPELDGWRRPFLSTSPRFALRESKLETMDFPEQDESMGEVAVSWPGPSCTQHLDVCALDLLGTYLTHSAVSPLQSELVEVEDPLCTDVDFYVSDRLRSTISITLSSVPTEELEAAEKQLFDVLEDVAAGEFDIDRMRHLIAKERLKVTNAVETDPHGAFATPIITDFLYGTRDGDSLKDALDDDRWLDEVSRWDAAQWQQCLRRFLLDTPHLTILGRPSARLAKELEEGENKRVADQVASLGEDGLARLTKRLKTAQDENDAPIPDHIITDFPVSAIDKVDFIRPETRRFGTVPAHLKSDSDACPELPFFVQLDSTAGSKFVTVNLYLVPSEVESELLPYVSVLLHSFFLNSLRRDGEVVDYEEIVEQLEQETISYDACFGAGSGFNELIRVKIRSEVGRYDNTVQWMQDLLVNPVFTADRIGVAISKIANDLPSIKRDGDTVASSVLSALLLKSGRSVARAGNVLQQTKFLETLEQQLEDDEEAVLGMFQKLQRQLVQVGNIYVHIAADPTALADPAGPWRRFAKALTPSFEPPLPIPRSVDHLSAYGAHPNGRATVITLPVESCYAHHIACGPREFDDADVPALLVMTSYLNAMEGLLWKYIRGAGLAYGADIKCDLEAGILSFAIYRAPDAYAAWARAKEVVEQLVAGELNISEAMVDGAKSALVYDLVSREATPVAAAHQSFVNQALKRQPADHVHQLLRKVQQVTVDQMKGVLQRHLARLFSESTSNVVVVCGPTKLDSIEAAFKEARFDVASSSLEEFEQAFIQ